MRSRFGDLGGCDTSTGVGASETIDRFRDDRGVSFAALIDGIIVEDFGVPGAEPGANAKGTSTTVLSDDEPEEADPVRFSLATQPVFSRSFLGGRSEASSILSLVWVFRLRKKKAATMNAPIARTQAITIPATAPAGRPELP